MSRALRLHLLLALLVAAPGSTCFASPDDPLEAAPAYAGQSAIEELASLRVAPGFRVELVAAEPLVEDPVSVAWDAKGRLWVAEMADYPVAPGGGRVRRLEDTDGDGLPDRSVLFAERLPFVTSILPLGDGVLVASAPDLRLLGPGGDRVVVTGFHEGNQQLRVNGLIWGIDGRIYGANGRSGGKARRPEEPESAAIDLGGRDFRLDLRTFAPEAAAGPSQYGHAFDAWGRRFLSWNTVHIRQAVLAPLDLERNPLLRRTATVASISDHGDSARVYPLAPPPRTFNQEPTDHFNASCGLTIEAGGIFPAHAAGSAFVCEPLVGIVHRDELRAGPGPALVAHRGEAEAEFLASPDPWFHPVFTRSGPDGALYIVDLYRELVEHPDFVPVEARRGVDFRRGHGHGRIFRVAPVGASLLEVEDLSALEPPALVLRLESPNARARETAQRLLLERGEADGRTRGALEALATVSRSAVARAWALWTLERLGALPVEVLRLALRSGDPRLQEAALRVAREPGRHDERLPLLPEVLSLARSPDPCVRLEALLALGEARSDGADGPVVAALAQGVFDSAGDVWLLSAILSGIAGREEAFLERLLGRGLDDVTPSFVPAIAEEAAELLAAREPGAAAGTLRLAASLLEGGRLPRGLALASGLAAGLARAGMPPREAASPGDDARRWQALFERARSVAFDAGSTAEDRGRATALLGHAPWVEAGEALERLLDPREPIELQLTAARALGAQGDDAATRALLDAWSAATPAVRRAVLDALARSPARVERLIEALERGAVRPRDLDLPGRAALLGAAGGETRARLERALGAPGAGAARGEVVERYRADASVDASRGDVARGAAVFEARCSPCHRLGGRGHAVGPDLASVGKKSREELLVSILDPNRSAEPGFAAYAASLASGRVVTGLLSAETARAITLRQSGGLEETIPRAELSSLEALGASLMPEGLEAELPPADLADLLAFLGGAGGP